MNMSSKNVKPQHFCSQCFSSYFLFHIHTTSMFIGMNSTIYCTTFLILTSGVPHATPPNTSTNISLRLEPRTLLLQIKIKELATQTIKNSFHSGLCTITLSFLFCFIIRANVKK